MRLISHVKELLLVLCWFLAVLYITSLIAQYEIFATIGSGLISPTDSAILLLSTPYLLIANLSLPLATFFLTNSVLCVLYIHMSRRAYIQHVATRTAYGLSTSFIHVVSIGCATCGSLFSPLALTGIVALPLHIGFALNITLSLCATLLLLVGIILQVRMRRKRAAQ